MAVLPPSVTAEAFASALSEFRAAVGADWVFTTDEDLHLYRDPTSLTWGTAEESVASAAVAPMTVEQVQAIVRVANKYKVPLFPISTGKNFAYGGPAPNLRGSVVVDLKRMSRILEVNEERNFALVEPGVTYFDLYRHIQERGLKVWIDCADVGWGGPMGNALDRGMGYTLPFYRDHAGASCGMEVVLANGDVIRTGTGAVPGSKTWQEYKHGYGPDPSGLFAQGNFGIVTKMGFRLMPQPEYCRTGLITVPKRQDLVPAVKILNYLSDSGFIGEIFFASPLRAFLDDPAFQALLDKPNGPADEELDRFAADHGVHSWMVELQFYGPEKTCLANWEYAKERFTAAVSGAKFVEGESLKIPLSEEDLISKNSPFPPLNWHRKVTHGVANMTTWAQAYAPGRSERNPNGEHRLHTGLFPVIPRSGEAIFEFQRVARQLSLEFGLSARDTPLRTPLSWPAFAYQVAFPMPADESRAREAFVRIIEVAAEHGWGDYRCPPPFQDMAVAAYSFGDHALRKFRETLKDATDPNGILAPGRGGVWPKGFRQFRKTSA